MFMHASECAPPRRGSPLSTLCELLHRGPQVLDLWLQRQRTRRALFDCDDRLLRDVGLTRAQADREAATPFWR